MPTHDSAPARGEPRTAPARGRPRDPSRDAAIHDAALELLAEVGYDRLSVDALAIRAGVSKATIYRRWTDKAAVVTSAIEHRAAGTPPDPPGHTLRGDLVVVLGWLATQIAIQDRGLLAAVVAGTPSDPELAAAMRDRLHDDEAAMIQRTLALAVQRGEVLDPNADQLFAQVAPAVIVHRILIAGECCDPPFLEHLVDDILLPLLRGR